MVNHLDSGEKPEQIDIYEDSRAEVDGYEKNKILKQYNVEPHLKAAGEFKWGEIMDELFPPSPSHAASAGVLEAGPPPVLQPSSPPSFFREDRRLLLEEEKVDSTPGCCQCVVS